MDLETKYRDILKIELAERISGNPAYSLRAMAKQAGISPSLLSDVLKGKKGLSSPRAFEVGQALQFDGSKLEYFVTLVQIEETKSEARKYELANKLQLLNTKRQTQDLSLDIFRMIYDWYHVAILELALTSNFQLTEKSAAEKLQITAIEAEAAIERLLRLELLKKTPSGKLERVENHLVASSKIPNTALRNFHSQMLKKASESLSSQTSQEKLIGSETIAFDKKYLKEANTILERCFQEIVALANSKKTKRDVYHLGIQLFRITKKESET